jgi:hypothetical protein
MNFVLNINKTNGNIKSQKIAICFFGVIARSIRYTYDSIKTNLIDVVKEHYDVDIYACNMDIEDSKIDSQHVNKNDVDLIPINYYENIIQSDFDKYIEDNYNERKFIMRSDYTREIIQNAIRQMYSEYKVGTWLEKNKGIYDAAIVCGPDYFLLNKVNISDIEFAINHPTTVFTTPCNPGQGYTNGFYIGMLDPLIKILKRFENLNNMLPTNRDYEYLLKNAFVQHNVTNKITNLFFFKIRNSGSIARQGIMMLSQFNDSYNKTNDYINSQKSK